MDLKLDRHGLPLDDIPLLVTREYIHLQCPPWVRTLLAYTPNSLASSIDVLNNSVRCRVVFTCPGAPWPRTYVVEAFHWANEMSCYRAYRSSSKRGDRKTYRAYWYVGQYLRQRMNNLFPLARS